MTISEIKEKIKSPDKGITHPEIPGNLLSYIKWRINLMRPMQFKLPWITFKSDF